MENYGNTQQKNLNDEDLYQISGGIKDFSRGQLFEDATKIDLLNTSFLSEKSETGT